MRRSDCYALIRAAGIPQPPRSSCYICPHRGSAQWGRLKNHSPDDWGRAVEIETEIRQKHPDLFLNNQRVPLAEVDLSEDQKELFDSCDEGICFT